MADCSTLRDNSDNKDEPKVTHGYTLVSNIPFRAVCETIRDVVDREASAPAVQGYAPAPILVSLENHCGPHGQLRLVQIMKEVWGDRLLSAPVREESRREQEGDDEPHVRLEELGSKIAVIVEYHLPEEADDSSSSSSSSSDSDEDDAEERRAREEYRKKKRAEPPAKIIPELAQLGVYAQSVKPRDTSWYTDGKPKDGPPFHLVNLSESGLAPHLSDHGAKIARHNSRHLIRVYPKGTRISSRNLSPIPFWAVGAQICALNWQTFGASMQLNDALFAGTAGYVLKPAALRAGGSGVLGSGAPRRILRLRVAGATDVPLPKNRDADGIKPYLTCTLLQPGSDSKLVKMKQKTAVYQGPGAAGQLVLNLLGRAEERPGRTDPLWNQTLEWEFDDNELVFLRMLIKSEDNFSSNTTLAVAAVRLLYVQPGWRFVRMLDLKGRETTCSLLVRFDVEDAKGKRTGGWSHAGKEEKV